MTDGTEPQEWLVPLTPHSLPRDLLADIGEMALSFAFAENRIAEALAIHGNSAMAKWTEKSLNGNLTALSKIRPSLHSAIAQMREDARCRNTIVHGALQAITGTKGGSIMKAHALNYSFGGHTQVINSGEIKRLANAAFTFAFDVIASG